MIAVNDHATIGETFFRAGRSLTQKLRARYVNSCRLIRQLATALAIVLRC